mmetsp:Transcript_26133/g.77529  ORF Transcript_26133/g.77529 Transcript_26133/m.77529 type:complete len:203 (-) Transcript_26133:76-684(-)
MVCRVWAAQQTEQQPVTLQTTRRVSTSAVLHTTGTAPRLATSALRAMAAATGNLGTARSQARPCQLGHLPLMPARRPFHRSAPHPQPPQPPPLAKTSTSSCVSSTPLPVTRSTWQCFREPSQAPAAATTPLAATAPLAAAAAAAGWALTRGRSTRRPPAPSQSRSWHAPSAAACLRATPSSSETQCPSATWTCMQLRGALQP